MVGRLYPPPPPEICSYFYLFGGHVTLFDWVCTPTFGKISLFQSRKIKLWNSKTSQYYILKEIYLNNQTSIFKFHKL